MIEIAEETASTQFAKLLERASKGEVIVITREGKPAVRMGPDVDHARTPAASEALATIQRLSRKYASRNITLDELRLWTNEGRP